MIKHLLLIPVLPAFGHPMPKSPQCSGTDLQSGFNYPALGVVPKPVSAYK